MAAEDLAQISIPNLAVSQFGQLHGRRTHRATRLLLHTPQLLLLGVELRSETLCEEQGGIYLRGTGQDETARAARGPVIQEGQANPIADCKH